MGVLKRKEKVAKMFNQWILKEGKSSGCFVDDTMVVDFDDYGWGLYHPTSIGDDISTEGGEYPQYGTVIGIIRNRWGHPVCYKVIRDNEDGTQEFDYMSPRDVVLSEPCGSSEWSLGRYGYKPVKNKRSDKCFYNPKTKDVIYS